MTQLSDHTPLTEEQIRAATIGELTPLTSPILLAEYDPEWPRLFEREEARVRAALGERALEVEHVGSTSVPGLAAKPVIDIVLVVADSADEPTSPISRAEATCCASASRTGSSTGYSRDPIRT